MIPTLCNGARIQSHHTRIIALLLLEKGCPRFFQASFHFSHLARELLNSLALLVCADLQVASCRRTQFDRPSLGCGELPATPPICPNVTWHLQRVNPMEPVIQCLALRAEYIALSSTQHCLHSM